MTKNVNLWVNAEKTWILDKAWMKCEGTTDPESLRGCSSWGGLDLSNVSGITAFVLIFHEDERFQLLPFFWIPEEKMLEKIRKENINYDLWVNAGLVKVTPGNVVDYDFVKADILRIIGEYDSFRRGFEPPFSSARAAWRQESCGSAQSQTPPVQTAAQEVFVPVPPR